MAIEARVLEALQAFRTETLSGRPFPDHARRLRVVGQAIEQLEWQAYEVEARGPDLLVRVEGARRPGDHQGPTRRPGAPGASLWELRCTPPDLQRLDAEGQARRQHPDGIPDPYAPSQLLSVVGGYLDDRGLQLIRVSRRGSRIRLEFSTHSGENGVEEHTVAGFYDRWVRMYLRRNGPPK